MIVSGLRGTVEVELGRRWVEVDIGNELGSENRVRLSGNNCALTLEFISGQQTNRTFIHIQKQGLFTLNQLISEWRNTDNAQKWLANFAQRLVGKHSREIVSMGTRGNLGTPVEKPAYRSMGDLAWESLEKGERERAAGQFEEALMLSPEDAMVEFQVGLCFSLDTPEKYSDWLSEALRLTIPVNSKWSGSALLIKSRALSRVGRMDEMETLIKSQNLADLDAETAQSLYLLLAFSRLSQGDREGTRVYVERITALGENSEATSAARQLLAFR